MPWDYFCPKCSATLVGGMIDGPDDEIERDMDKYRGKIINCNLCNTNSYFDTMETVEGKCLGEVIKGG